MNQSERVQILIFISFLVWLLVFIGQTWLLSCSAKIASSSPRTDHLINEINSHHQQNIRSRVNRRSVSSYKWLNQTLISQYTSHNVNIDAFESNTLSKEKYLVYVCDKPCGGWGDRTRKIVGSFLLALALNRSFIIRMNWPCSLEKYLEPNIIQWNRAIDNEKQRSSVNIYNLSSSDNDYRRILSWENIDIVFFGVKDLAYYSMLLWRDDLYRVLHLNYGLDRSILFIHTAFKLSYELLFKLKSHSQGHLDTIENKYHLNSLICAHIRIGRNPSNPNDDIFPKRERMNETVIAFIKNISRSNETIFISTDSQDVLSYARKQFSSRLLTIEGTIKHIDRSGTQQSTCDGFEKAILDFYMIGKCRKLVISKSAFSYWGNMRRVKPYSNLFLYCDGMKTIKNPSDYDRYPYAKC